jgi:hypothetical protein
MELASEALNYSSKTKLVGLKPSHNMPIWLPVAASKPHAPSMQIATCGQAPRKRGKPPFPAGLAPVVQLEFAGSGKFVNVTAM